MAADGYLRTTWREPEGSHGERPHRRRFALGPDTVTFDVPPGRRPAPGEITDDATGEVLCCRTRDGEELKHGLAPDDVALLLLLIYAQVPETTSSCGLLRFL